MGKSKKKRNDSEIKGGSKDEELFRLTFFNGEIPKDNNEEKPLEVDDSDEEIFKNAMEQGIRLNVSNEEIHASEQKDKNRARRRFPYAVLDLHGMTVAQAMNALLDFLQAELKRGSKTVLVIHGKGSGALRDAVWTLIEEHSAVLDFQIASAKFGGSGALVVRLNNKPHGRRNF